MPTIGEQCHELRILDAGHAWRIIYHVEPDSVVILEVFAKKTATTPGDTLNTCRRRLAAYRNAVRRKGGIR
jgi:phage-related protein